MLRGLAFSAAVSVAMGPFAAYSDDHVETADFITGNALHILLHEIGHLLIDQIDLPVLGQEEDAADNYATLTLIEWDTGLADQALADTAYGWFLRHDDTQSADESIFFTEHDLDVQRAYRVVCHLIGIDERAFGPLADDFGVYPDETQSCDYSSDLSAKSWARVLSPFAPGKVGLGAPVKIEYAAGDGDLGYFEDLLRGREVLEIVSEHLLDTVSLPRPVFLRTEMCGEANAYYDPERVEVTLCYELLDEIAALYESSKIEH
ncbi:MAG: DUF4344 domain-containing metallopeptidase [Pikeienuella sp.]